MKCEIELPELREGYILHLELEKQMCGKIKLKYFHTTVDDEIPHLLHVWTFTAEEFKNIRKVFLDFEEGESVATIKTP